MQGLYLHVPFCARACPYCNFDFEVGRQPDVDAYLGGLRREIASRRAEGEIQPGPWDTVYFGGGTPSLLGSEGLASLCQLVEQAFPGSGKREWTVEVNPEHASTFLFRRLLECGVTRVSLGVQTLHSHGLAELGRAHSRRQALDAIACAHAIGLQVSADLILGYHGQYKADLAADIDAITTSGASHLSIYALTVEPDTPWVRLVDRGKRQMPDSDAQAGLLRAAHDLLHTRGYLHYEVASYGRGAHRAVHNQLYWTWSNYMGIGPSAHSARYTQGVVTRRGNVRGLKNWLKTPEKSELEVLTGEAAAREGLWLGLRRLTGVTVDNFLAAFPQIDHGWLAKVVARQLDLGNLEWAEGRQVLRVAPDRWLWHDTVAEDLLG